jgi:uncharacterized protein (TIGR03437 family)
MQFMPSRMLPRLTTVFLVALATVLPLPADTPGVTLGQAVLSQGNAVINITFTPLDQAVTGVQFDIRFSPQAFGLSASAGSALSAAGKNLWTSNPDPASLRILIAGLNQTALPAGVIATLSVQVNSATPAAVYPLEVDNAVGSDANGMAVFLPVNNGSVTVTGPGPTVAAVANAASWTTGAVAPGEIVVIGGNGMGTTTLNTLQITAAGQVATILAGTRVLFDGIPAPLIYASQNQLSAIVPYEVNGHSQTSLQVEYLGVQSSAFVLPVAAAAPGIFTVDTSGSGQGAIFNQDGTTINGPGSPAPRGSTVSIFGTGDGQTLPAGADGIIIGSPSDLRYTLLPVTASIGGQNAEVIYSGSVGGQVAGMFQANIRIPQSVVPGDSVPVTLWIGTSNTQPGVTMAVQ